MFGVISDLLRRPFTLWRFVEIVAPGFAADGGALKHAVFCVGLCLLTSPFALAFGAHGATPALATGFVRASLQEEAGYGKRCQECCSSNQLLRHNKVSLSLQTGRGALCRLSGSVQGQYLRHTGVYRTVSAQACAIRDKPALSLLAVGRPAVRISGELKLAALLGYPSIKKGGHRPPRQTVHRSLN